MKVEAKTVVRRLILIVTAIYLALLGYSHYGRLVAVPRNAPQGCCLVSVPADPAIGGRVTIAYLDQEAQSGAIPLILLHGSPGSSGDFTRIMQKLDGRRRLIAPDLPGFGRSERNVPDYSVRAHAGYVISMMDALGIERAHLLGFSMGGGVVLNVCDLAPERVESVIMLSAIGVQEMELLGDYRLNHAIHGVQLGLLKLLRLALPLTPDFVRSDISIPYARNFYDTDQRPLRGILERYRGPMLIIHGRKDFLVPVEAAVEHHRIVPQSELELTGDDHFMVFMKPDAAAGRIDEFISRLDAGGGTTRDLAEPSRLAEAKRPLDPSDLPRYVGITAFIVVLLLATATLVSEDLTCIAAGVLASQGRLSFALATIGCFLGIFVGDLMLYLAGRWLGRPALRVPPLRWLISPVDLERSSNWFSRQGPKVIFLSRFMPGTRLPSYFAAGALQTSFRSFALYFLLACAVWTPILVGLSMLLGGNVVESAFMGGQSILLRVILAVMLTWLAVSLLVRASTHRGRRLLLSSWRRLTRWEFWPPLVFYPPVVVFIIWQMLKYRSSTVFTAANPAIPGGGFIGESKAAILSGLGGSSGFLPKWMLIEGNLESSERTALARSFMAAEGLGYPVVLKPDTGQRGSGVAIIQDDDALERYLELADFDVLIQQYVPGDEFGIFYYRYPGEPSGRIFAITEKRLPVVVGDGRRTLEELILDDDRAVCMAGYHLRRHAGNLGRRIDPGREYPLVDLGTHSRGAIFLDGGTLITPELERSIDLVSRGFDGFYFGRFDVRVDDLEALRAGKGFMVIELNGVTSEATSLYDPSNSLLDAYRILFKQWRIAFAIGEMNRKLGFKPASAASLIASIIEYREKSASHERFQQMK